MASRNWRKEQAESDRETELLIAKMLGVYRRPMEDCPREFNSFKQLNEHIDNWGRKQAESFGLNYVEESMVARRG